MSLKVLPLKLYRVQTDVDNQLRAIVCLHADGMLCIKYHGHQSVCRRNHSAVRWYDCCSFSQNLLAEGGVAYLAHGNGCSADRRCDYLLFLFFSPE